MTLHADRVGTVLAGIVCVLMLATPGAQAAERMLLVAPGAGDELIGSIAPDDRIAATDSSAEIEIIRAHELAAAMGMTEACALESAECARFMAAAVSATSVLFAIPHGPVVELRHVHLRDDEAATRAFVRTDRLHAGTIPPLASGASGSITTVAGPPGGTEIRVFDVVIAAGDLVGDYAPLPLRLSLHETGTGKLRAVLLDVGAVGPDTKIDPKAALRDDGRRKGPRWWVWAVVGGAAAVVVAGVTIGVVVAAGR